MRTPNFMISCIATILSSLLVSCTAQTSLPQMPNIDIPEGK
jgi:hypothetical protein